MKVPKSLRQSALKTLEGVVAAGTSLMTKVITSDPFSHMTTVVGSDGPASRDPTRFRQAGLPIVKPGKLTRGLCCPAGALFGGFLGNCDSMVPPPPECWHTGGAIHVKYDPPAAEHAHASVCVVFFSPGSEKKKRRAREIAKLFSASIELACDDRRGPLMGVVDLSELAKCIFTQLTTDLGTRLQPRAVLVVPDDATPGRVLRSGHIFYTRRTLSGHFWVHSGDLVSPEYNSLPVMVYVLGPAFVAV